MSKTPEERCAVLEKVVKKQRATIAEQGQEIDKLWENFRRLLARTELLRKAAPHVNFENW